MDQTSASLLVRCRTLLSHLCSDSRWPLWESLLFGITTGLPDLKSDPSFLAHRILEHLGELDGTVIAAPFRDVRSWQREVFDLTPSESYTAAFTKLVLLLEQTKSCSGMALSGHGPNISIEQENGDSKISNAETHLPLSTGVNTCAHTHSRSGLFGVRVPTFGVNFLAQTLTEFIETKLHFALSLLVLLIRYQLNPTLPDYTYQGGTGIRVLCDDLIMRLTQLIHALRIPRWLGRTRMAALPESKKLSEIREHLNILGLARSESRDDPNCELIELDANIATQFPGATLLEQILFTWLSEVPASQWLPATDENHARLVERLVRPWALRCGVLLPRLSVELNPLTNYGLGLARVYRHLLLGGRASALIHLSHLLAPSDRTPIDVASRHFDCDEAESANEDVDSWYCNVDHSLLHLCVGLARIWLDQPELAKEEFIEASTWLHWYIEASANESSGNSSMAPFCRSVVTPPGLNELLLCSLFAKSFAPDKLYCTPVYGFSPDEAQLRFLMKVMPVLEAKDCVAQVINLVEFALNRLASVRLVPSVSGELSTTMQAPWLRRVTTVLTGLHAHHDGSDEGFLCEPVPDENLFDRSTMTGKLYIRLADLEAALWTRMFKHQLALGDYTRAFMLIRSNPDSAR
ncbi:unnamed protein product [Echinostoma caproni]|uniref:Non-specific serine/threonine protein kinase n=1 Tax=Echinostoma caproni TaxID=27848 RepID=A0A183AYW8_9TREM|nr:unnamed protein product [Echinostoma caproni]